MIETCRGLAVAHAAGVMHRDIKPGNLLVREGDRVKITDFGVSRSMDQTTLTQTGMVMGTAQYLAPEMALGKPATAQSDLYALGIIAYEAVNGKRPFTAPAAVDIAIAHVNEAVPALPSTVSPGLAKLIMDLLEKSPRKRPKDARDLIERIGRLDLAADGSTPASDAPSVPSPAEASRSRSGATSRAMPPRSPLAPTDPDPTPPGGGDTRDACSPRPGTMTHDTTHDVED
ncbi:hypothetical protein GCM10025876_18940 [Demequina litorisediminis]|uniref:non-specific serine/threonine protein kinase n=1 Tax=Demequina litorisediminis TaxID=1849022 RepID=A0ABQ6ID99_9MICO|nr:hypothetical protein GCM10025876_18940 [Demequina litorisediminis]